MKQGKIFSGGAFLIGVALLIVSHVIHSRVEEGEGQIASAEKRLKQGDRLLSLTPMTRELSHGVKDKAQKKIHAAKQEAASYDRLADHLQVLGAIIAGLGVVLFLMAWNKRKK